MRAGSFRRRDMYPAAPDPRLVASLGAQACEGLHHAHQLKRSDGQLMEVVHRDVSSNNLFATVDGVVKVLDFGIAKVQDASVRTSTGSVKGTYAYMAPEQLRGEKLDRRTDVFAMGIVLWELFSRRHPLPYAELNVSRYRLRPKVSRGTPAEVDLKPCTGLPR